MIVITGALFNANPHRIGKGGVAVPDALYKVILVSDGDRNRLIAS